MEDNNNNKLNVALIYSQDDAASNNLARAFINQADTDNSLTLSDKNIETEYFILEREYDIKHYEKISSDSIISDKVSVFRSKIRLLDTDTVKLSHFGSYDLCIFLSKHRAASGNNAITIHAIGNFCDADYGGIDKRIVKTNPALLSKVYRELKVMSINTSVGKYTVSFEAVHHGPYSKIPSIFLEVGSEEKNWNDSEAAEFASKALFLALKSEIKPKDSIFIMGGNHYCAAAYDFIEKFDFAGSCAKHNNECVTEEQLLFISQNYDHLLLDYNSLKDKQRITGILDSQNIKWFKTREFRRLMNNE